jgi:hypothetical protein
MSGPPLCCLPSMSGPSAPLAPSATSTSTSTTSATATATATATAGFTAAPA